MGRSPGAYRSEKRSKELARRKKQEEKRKRKLDRASGAAPLPQTAEAPEAPLAIADQPS